VSTRFPGWCTLPGIEIAPLAAWRLGLNGV
jgi:hypothetical protein